MVLSVVLSAAAIHTCPWCAALVAFWWLHSSATFLFAMWYHSQCASTYPSFAIFAFVTCRYGEWGCEIRGHVTPPAIFAFVTWSAVFCSSEHSVMLAL